MTTMDNRFFLGRQPILDKANQLVAFELLFRNAGKMNEAVVSDDFTATAEVISHAFSELGLSNVLGPYKGFINMDAGMLYADLIELLPADQIVLEVLETVDIDDALVARCEHLASLGFKIAMDDILAIDERVERMMKIISIVKIDVLGTTREQLGQIVPELKARGLQVLAEKVDNAEQADYCRSIGCDLFQGYYFAKPVVIAGRRMDPSRLAVLDLLGLIVADADNSRLEQVFKHYPDLSVNLMRLVNSVACGLPTKISGLGRALTVLGRRQLQRWLQLLLFVNKGQTEGFASPLLQLAATRGKLMELLAIKMNRQDRDLADRAYMTGILSLVDTLLGVPLPEIIQPLNLSDDVVEGLLNHTGRLGAMLMLVESMDRAEPDAMFAAMSNLPELSPEDINQSLTDALNWANHLSQEADN